MKKNNAFASALVMAAALVGGLTSCNNANNADATVAAGDSQQAGAALPVAFIKTDSLISNYQLAVDLNREMTEKAVEAQNGLNRKLQSLQNEIAAYQQRVQTFGFLTDADRKKSEASLNQKQNQLEQERQQLDQQFALVQSQNLVRINDSIQSAIKAVNNGKYDIVLAYEQNATVFFAKEELDITKQVLEVLNSRYESSK